MKKLFSSILLAGLLLNIAPAQANWASTLVNAYEYTAFGLFGLGAATMGASYGAALYNDEELQAPRNMHGYTALILGSVMITTEAMASIVYNQYQAIIQHAAPVQLGEINFDRVEQLLNQDALQQQQRRLRNAQRAARRSGRTHTKDRYQAAPLPRSI